MKNFLQGLLIFFSLCLCALITFQWVREVGLRKQLQQQADADHQRLEASQGVQAQLRRTEDEIKRLEGIRADLASRAESEGAEVQRFKQGLAKAEGAIENCEKQAAAYKRALDAANEAVQTANENIKRQNEEMKKLAEERDTTVTRFNKLAVDFNELAAKWNRRQEELTGVATNAPTSGRK